jgi:predicted NAD-dependent protein-ADP-ribosyltransferase YbiA (DUF1768 family)
MIDFFKVEEYDTSKLTVIPFYKKTDTYNGISLDFGNMTNGHSITVGGYNFCCVELAYIAAFFSKNTEECKQIQTLIQQSNNGMMAKRKYRKGAEYKVHGREDFDDSLWHFHFMLALVWKKCKSDSAFRKALLSLPKDCIIVENEPRKGDKPIWGCKNAELQDSLKDYERRTKLNFSTLSEKEQKEHVDNFRMKVWNKVGTWKGYNAMGKILMECKQALEESRQPCIDKELLNSANIYWFGQKLKFE